MPLPSTPAGGARHRLQFEQMCLGVVCWQPHLLDLKILVLQIFKLCLLELFACWNSLRAAWSKWAWGPGPCCLTYPLPPSSLESISMDLLSPKSQDSTEYTENFGSSLISLFWACFFKKFFKKKLVKYT